MIKTFRGKLADGGQDTIRLSTNTGLTGYRIVKFQLITAAPGAASIESIVKIFSVDPDATPTGTIDFNDPTILGAGYITENDATQYSISNVIVFDQTVFNQDIYITHKDVSIGQAVNYYLELEQVKLAKDEAAVATLKDMRGRE